MHLLAAYLPKAGVVLAQAEVERKEHEIVVAPTVLARLPLRGVVVVGYALHPQRAISSTIVEANGDVLWFVDQNQPTVLDDIRQLFVEPGVMTGWSLPPTDVETARSCEGGHGRVEERIITVSSMLQDYTPWPYLAHVFKLERRWWDAKGEHDEVRYGLTSLPSEVAAPADLLRIARGVGNRERVALPARCDLGGRRLSAAARACAAHECGAQQSDRQPRSVGWCDEPRGHTARVCLCN